MRLFLFDASALVKRYTLEPLIDLLFAHSTPGRFQCLMLGVAEVVAALARKRNRGDLAPPMYDAAMVQLRAEVINVPGFIKVAADNALIDRALTSLQAHAINANDAIVLMAALNKARQLRTTGDDLVLVSSDQRLLNAAKAEGLTSFDPVTQTQAELNSLLGP